MSPCTSESNPSTHSGEYGQEEGPGSQVGPRPFEVLVKYPADLPRVAQRVEAPVTVELEVHRPHQPVGEKRHLDRFGVGIHGGDPRVVAAAHVGYEEIVVE